MRSGRPQARWPRAVRLVAPCQHAELRAALGVERSDVEVRAVVDRHDQEAVVDGEPRVGDALPADDLDRVSAQVVPHKLGLVDRPRPQPDVPGDTLVPAHRCSAQDVRLLCELLHVAPVGAHTEELKGAEPHLAEVVDSPAGATKDPARASPLIFVTTSDPRS